MTTLSLGGATMDTRLLIRRDRAWRLQQRQHLLGLRLKEIHRAADLDIEPYQGLGVRAAQIEAPVRELERHAVGSIQNEGLRRIACLEGRDGRLRLRDPKIELTADRTQPDPLPHQL